MKKILVLAIFVTLTICIIFSDPLSAQPTLFINRIELKWPEVTVWFRAKCDTIDRYDITNQNLLIKEDGAEINQYQLWCPDSNNVIRDCSIKYFSHCMDGTRRNVELTLLNLSGCPGNPDRAVRSYKAPRDTATFMPITIKLVEDTVLGDQAVYVPLVLDTPINGGLFNKATFKILFDDQCIQFQNVMTNAYLLDSVAIDAVPITGGYQLTITKAKPLNDTGILAMLKFKASNPEQNRECPLKLFGWTFDAGCLRPMLVDGNIFIVARKPIMDCSVVAPTQLTFDSTSNEYSPNPFAVIINVVNRGNRESRNGIATISVDKNDLLLVSPLTTKQSINPKVTQDSGGTSTARWNLFAQKRINGDSIKVCITVTFVNHPDVTCCTNVLIPSSPLTNVDNANSKLIPFNYRQNYPNPFSSSTTIEIRNAKYDGRTESGIALKVFDLLGREVLDLSEQAKNNSSVVINKSQLPKAGVYIYRLQNGNKIISRKMIMIE